MPVGALSLDPVADAGPRTGRFRRATKVDDSNAAAVDLAVARAKAGDSDAIRYLYLRYADNVYGYVRSIVRDDHEAEDITQQVFAKLITAIGKYERRTAPFSAWILRVARNVAMDHLRSARVTPCDEIRAVTEAEDDESHERARALREAFRLLPEEQRSVLMLRHVLGLSPTEIAERLGRSEGSVHGLHHRGRRAIQEQLAGMGLAPATGT
jgi:RNA polymerase sigma-70 factor, ECF subfamily